MLVLLSVFVVSFLIQFVFFFLRYNKEPSVDAHGKSLLASYHKEEFVKFATMSKL